MMKTFRSAAAAALGAVLLAGPAGAQSPSADVAQNALYKRMVALNAALRSYTAAVHLDVSLKTFPYISPSLDGNVYYRSPDKEAVVFDTVPALAAQFKKVYPKIDPPARWFASYDVALARDERGATTFRLTPKRSGRVDHLDVTADDASATIKNFTWTYKDGGSVSIDQTYSSVAGNYLVDKQIGRVDLPSYKADVASTFRNYRLNVPIDDSVFQEK